MLPARDPATGATLGEVKATSPERVEEIVAGVARVQPLWALLRVVDRARYMHRMAQAIVDELDPLTERSRASRAARGRRSPRWSCSVQSTR